MGTGEFEGEEVLLVASCDKLHLHGQWPDAEFTFCCYLLNAPKLYSYFLQLFFRNYPVAFCDSLKVLQIFHRLLLLNRTTCCWEDLSYSICSLTKMSIMNERAFVAVILRTAPLYRGCERHNRCGLQKGRELKMG